METNYSYGLIGSSPKEMALPPDCQIFADAGAALRSSPLPDIFLLDVLSPAFAQSQLNRLRSHAQAYYRPIFLTHNGSDSKLPAADGFYSSTTERDAMLSAYSDRLHSLGNHQPPQAPQDRLLYYLFLRPRHTLLPLRNYRHPTLHHYPELDALLAGPDGLALCEALRNQDYLHAAQARAKQRECPKCSSPHLQFIDQCPRCHSFSIDQKPFIHCFSCGHIAPQDDYLKPQGLQCPQCATDLHQIGVDYDRPLEQGHCGDCGFLFGEPEVQAHCLQCGQANEPDALRTRMVHEYELAPQGVVAVRAGGMQNLQNEQEQANLVSQSTFRHTLSWAMRLSHRYTEMPFALISFALSDPAALERDRGYQAASRITEDLLLRIQALFRNTDQMVRRSSSSVLILLPQTPLKACEVIRQRIAETLTNVEITDRLALPFHFRMLSLPADLEERDNAESVTVRCENIQEH